MSTPTYGWPFPTQSMQPNVPADVQRLAEAIDEDLGRVEGSLSTPRAVVYRTATDVFNAGGMVALGLGLTIPGAPAGVYLIGWSVIVASADSTKSGNLRITVDGGAVNADQRCDITTYSQVFSGAHPHAHAADGALAVQSYFQIPTGSARVHQGSQVMAVRIGSI